MQDIEEKAQAGSLLSSDLFNEDLYLWKYARGDEGPREYLVSVIGTNKDCRSSCAATSRRPALSSKVGLRSLRRANTLS